MLEISTAFRDACGNTEGRPEQFLCCRIPVSWERFNVRGTVDLFGTAESANVTVKLVSAS
jgi:hypothetical protein